MEAPLFPLSSRAKPRDLRFYGPFLGMFFTWFTRTKQRPGGEATGARFSS
jgi:hypothetical protein